MHVLRDGFPKRLLTQLLRSAGVTIGDYAVTNNIGRADLVQGPQRPPQVRTAQFQIR